MARRLTPAEQAAFDEENARRAQIEARLAEHTKAMYSVRARVAGTLSHGSEKKSRAAREDLAVIQIKRMIVRAYLEGVPKKRLWADTRREVDEL